MKSGASKLLQLGLLILAAAVFFTGIGWGLPSREGDRFLLGSDYHGMRLEGLTGRVPEVDASRGADVTAGGSGPLLNDTDARRAQILCRYRLYSFQPDEMITFRSLSQMKPSRGDFDPRLYQYGGLWIYGVAGLIEVGHRLGLLDIADRGTYIGNPELFGRFYVVARAYSAAWGVLGAWAVFALIRRMNGGAVFLASMGALSFICLPVVIDLAHEAKPHLAGGVLILLAVLAGDRCLRLGRIRWAWILGMLCGAAAGMVLWGFVAWVLIAVVAWLSRRGTVAIYALAAAAAVYSASNPYVIYHLLHDPGVLRSNLGNTSAMYHVARPGLFAWNAVELICAGTGPVVLLAGLVGCAIAVRRRWKSPEILTAVVSAAILIPFVAMAAGKPGEYARFALLADVALVMAAMAAVGNVGLKYARGILAGAVVLATACYGAPYLRGFLADCSATDNSRLKAAAMIEGILRDSHLPQPTLGVEADPAPYCLPPVDLDGWKIVRLSRGESADLMVKPMEMGSPWIWGGTPISWADKQFVLLGPGEAVGDTNK